MLAVGLCAVGIFIVNGVVLVEISMVLVCASHIGPDSFWELNFVDLIRVTGSIGRQPLSVSACRSLCWGVKQRVCYDVSLFTHVQVWTRLCATQLMSCDVFMPDEPFGLRKTSGGLRTGSNPSRAALFAPRMPRPSWTICERTSLISRTGG